MLNVLAILLLFGLPLLVIPNSIAYFEIPKVIVGEILIGSLALTVFFRSNFSFKKFSPIGLTAIAIIFAISLLDFLLQPQSEAFWGNIFRLQGVFQLWILLLLGLIAHKLPFKGTWPIIAFISLLGLAVSCFFWGVNGTGRIVGSLGEPNALAATVVFLYTLTFDSKKPLWVILASLICFGIVFVSGSRSGLVAYGVVSLFYLLSAKKTFSISNRLGIGLIIILISMLLPLIEPQIWYEDRSEIWQTSFVAGLDAPILGHGFGNSTQVIHQTAERLQNNIRFQFVDSGHNIFLEYWLSGGILGLASLVVLIFLSLKHQIKKGQLALIAAWLGLLTMFSFNPMSMVNLIELWWLIGLGIERD